MKKIIQSIVLIILSNWSIAQQLPLYSQYSVLSYLYNPSLAGQNETVNAGLLHRSQWKGISGSPTTSVLTMDGPIAVKNIGLAATVFNDVTDVTSRMGFYTSYSYKLKITENQKVLFGLSLGVIQQRIDLTRAVIKDASDPYLMFPSNLRATIFDANLGLTYCWKTLQVGISVPQITGSKVNYINTNSSLYYTLARHYALSLKYSIDVNKERGMTVYPLILVRYASGAPIQYDINAVFDWKKLGWASITYRSNSAIGVNIGFRVNNSLRTGYAYDYNINTIKNYAGGAHELFLGYTFGGGAKENIDKAKNDSIIDALKTIDKKQEGEIEKLRNEFKKLNQQLKDSIKSSGTAAQSQSGVIPNADFRHVKVTDFKSEEGKDIIKGFYIVIGAFKSAANASALKEAQLVSYPEANLFFNKDRGLHYVYIVNGDSEESSRQIMFTLKKKFSDIWIYDME